MTDHSRRRSQFIDGDIDIYCAEHSTGPDSLQVELQRVTREKTGDAAGMQVGDDQAILMEILVRAMGVTRAIEVGTFTGYSALAIARGLPTHGRLLCCDVSEEWTSIARSTWEKAGVSDRIELRIGPAIDTLRSLPTSPVIDFAFIDADKRSYPIYFEEILLRMREGGVILLDNVLQGGRVLGDRDEGDDVAAIRTLNDDILSDSRVRVVQLPLGDGISCVQKK